MSQNLKPSSFYNEDAEASDSEETSVPNSSHKSAPTNEDDPKTVNQNSPLIATYENALAPDANTGRISNTSGETEETITSDEGEANAAACSHLAGVEKLSVNEEIKELFKFVLQYTPQTIQLEFKLKPFNPEFIPAVGNADPFIKIPRPDKKITTLGLTVLDEPAGKQSDPTALDLQLRVITKGSDIRSMAVKTIKNAALHPDQVKNWIDSVEKIHKSSPPTSVLYSKSMPDTDYLMQEWPAEFEELLSSIELPSADLSCSLETYIDVICSILDIPVYSNRVQSLHVLFSLYTAFRDVQMFYSIDEKNELNKVTAAETNILHNKKFQSSSNVISYVSSPSPENLRNDRASSNASVSIKKSSAKKSKLHQETSPALENLLHDEQYFPSKKFEQSNVIEQLHRTAVKSARKKNKSTVKSSSSKQSIKKKVFSKDVLSENTNPNEKKLPNTQKLIDRNERSSFSSASSVKSSTSVH